jgi:hypothetical protein
MSLTPIQRSRRAETKRFGAPVHVLLACGFLGAAFIVRWVMKARPGRWEPLPSILAEELQTSEEVTEQAQVQALLDEVRAVLGRFGISLGHVQLQVHLMRDLGYGLEGSTTKVIRPPPLLRGIEVVKIRAGMPAIDTAQVLAHEYTHCWLWLQGFPPLDTRLEEGLCELFSYLYLLSRLRGEAPSHVALARDVEALQDQIASIEANAHPDYGGGFRDCVAALRGRSLHDVLAHVRAHSRLPPALADAATFGGVGVDSLPGAATC